MTDSKLTGKLNALAVVLMDCMRACVDERLNAIGKAGTEGAAAGKKLAVNKKDLAEKQKAAKQIAAKFLKELGKDKLAELLETVGAKKFPDIKDLENLRIFTSEATRRIVESLWVVGCWAKLRRIWLTP